MRISPNVSAITSLADRQAAGFVGNDLLHEIRCGRKHKHLRKLESRRFPKTDSGSFSIDSAGVIRCLAPQTRSIFDQARRHWSASNTLERLHRKNRVHLGGIFSIGLSHTIGASLRSIELLTLGFHSLAASDRQRNNRERHRSLVHH